MSFNHRQYLERYQQAPGNDATDYGVRIVEADVHAGETYWRVIGAHHLEPDENWGCQAIYLDVLDEMGRRIQVPPVWAGWTWQGRDESIPLSPIALSGPLSGPAGHLLLTGSEQRVSVWLKGLYADATDKSDQVQNLHTNHPQELTADGQLGNGPGRHSFYIVFQRMHRGATLAAESEPEAAGAAILAAPAVLAAEAAPEALSPRRTHKIGLDANRPIITEPGPSQGALSPTVANPEMIAESGAAWVRINFVLGPWLGPGDETRFQGRTWAETYESIIDQYMRRGLSIYGLIGHEAMRTLPDFFRDPQESMPPHEITQAQRWIAEYATNFGQIVKRFYPKVKVVESFNEPDDWHGGQRHWIHPYWLAEMLQAIHDEVRGTYGLGDVTLVSGPLQGLLINGNMSPTNYLRQVYQYGQTRLGWGQAGRAWPFDGVGYHLYVHEGYNPDWSSQERAVRQTYREYVDGMLRVVRTHEGPSSRKQLYISEIGWPSNRDTAEEKEFQARNLNLALGLILDDPAVALGIWFCTEDFAPGHKFYGLYQMGRVTPEGRKPAFGTFKSVCDRLVQAPVEPEPVSEVEFSNQTLLTAFYRVAKKLGLDGWALLKRAQANPGRLVQNRLARYDGPALDELALSNTERQLLKQALTDLTGLAAGTAEAVAAGPSVLSVEDVTVGPAVLTAEAEPGFLRLRPELAELPLAPPADLCISSAAAQSSDERRAVAAWNRYGWLLLNLADVFRIEPGVALAVMAIESGGRGFAGDGRMIIRFENHIFHKYWGQHQSARFDQHFRFDPERKWQKHQWRAAPAAPWQDFHGVQSGEWAVFELARNLEPRAALLSISMGAPQIMGFNHQIVGYDSVEAMFEAFSLSERAQLLGFFDFVCGPRANPRRLLALQEQDFETFAALYNGPGQAAQYGSLLQSALETFKRLSPLT